MQRAEKLSDISLGYLSELRSHYHSLDSVLREVAIQKLAGQKTSDSTRELIHVFNECGWRETKFQILKAIHINPDLRCLDFLFQQATQTVDLPLAEAAIQALGETKNIWAIRFLRSYYQHGNHILKPACILALAQLSDRGLINDFLNDLKIAKMSQQTLLVKNIILALGELKVFEAIPVLIETAQDKTFRDVALSAVVSLGKISKTTQDFDKLEIHFSRDSFEYQIFNHAKSQCQFRSGWKLEDYLNKLIQTQNFHQALLLEFNAFTSTDVKAALDLLASPEHSLKLFQLLAKLEFPEISSWYSEYSSLVNDLNKDYFFKSLSAHHNQQLMVLIDKFSAFDNVHWLEAKLLNADQTIEVFESILKSEIFKSFSEDDQVKVLNGLFNNLLATQPQQKTYQACCKVLENFYFNFSFSQESFNLKGRLIRMFGELKYKSHKLTQDFLIKLGHKNLRQSVLVYFSHQESHIFSQNFLKNPNYAKTEVKILLKIFLNSNETQINEKNLKTFFDYVLKSEEEDIQILFLKMISQRVLVQYKDHVLSLSKSADHTLQLQSILTLKVFKDETLADHLAVFLDSDSLSVSGRVLDGLLSTPGNRAKRLIFEYLQNSATDFSVVEKITRSFIPPDNDTDYFYKVVDKILGILESKNQGRLIIQMFKEFRESLYAHAKSFSKVGHPTDADIVAIDQEMLMLIPAYEFFDESSKSALRSASIPFKHPEFFDQFVDKSSVVMGYSKAIDIVLEKQLGRKILYPKLENKLNEFQNVIHSLGLNEDYPVAENLLSRLKLEKDFSVQSLPVHKISLVAKGIMNSKILNEHFKILDGLRAWAVMLLVFARPTQASAQAIITVVDDDASCILLAKKLMWLQDIRNPMAHRQTLNDFKDIEMIRNEVYLILKLMNKLLFS